MAVWITQSVCSCSHIRNSWQSRPRHVQQCVPHNQPTFCMRCSIRSTQSAAETPVQLSGLPRVFVHALAFLSTPSHADAAEFSSTPSHTAAAAHDLCSFHHSPRVRQCLTVVAPLHRVAAPQRAVMGIKRRPVERPVEHACAEAPRAPRN